MKLGWLKTAGQIILKIAATEAGVEPILQGILPPKAANVLTEVTGELTKISQVVTTAEAMVSAITDPNASNGALKLKAATPFVAAVIKQSEMLSGKKIADEAAFIAACEKITGGFADLLNSLEAHS